MTNKEILSTVKRLVKYMELHGVNEFKVQGYQRAIRQLEYLHRPLATLSSSDLQKIDGVGKSVAATVAEVAATGTSAQLQDYEATTPAGLKELLPFRGLGPKKLRGLWQDFGITDKYALKELIRSGQLLSAKAFGAKTVSNLEAVVDYAIACEGFRRYDEAEEIGTSLSESLAAAFPGSQTSLVGKLRRQWEVIDAIELLTTVPLARLTEFLASREDIAHDKKKSGPFSWKGQTKDHKRTTVIFYPTTADKFVQQLLLKTGSAGHLNQPVDDDNFKGIIARQNWTGEEEAYRAAGLPWCPPEIREGSWELTAAKTGGLPKLLEPADIKGIIHCHSTYSDGQNTLGEMAAACQQRGYQYLGITDHSKAANFYANGMFEETVARQQAEIEELNSTLAPFKILKGIEADILADGALDYDAKTLASFDLVIASVHSGLNMDKNKATERLITAIANPYTTMLGHLTGRLLLQRQGYPVDHEAIINACAEFAVIIEINAHPSRLDIDWRWVHKALDKGLILSINPDAHEIAGFDHLVYGLNIGRKGGLTAEQTFNAWPLAKVSNYLNARKAKI